MRFDHEIWLYFIPMLLLLWLFLRWSDQRSLGTLQQLLGDRTLDHIEKSNSRLRDWKRFLLFCTLFWLLLGLATPQWGANDVVVTAEGADIVIALDISQSMLVRDVAPTRLDAVRTELRSFLDQLSDTRVGLVFFSGMAAVQNPLTLDYGITAMFLEKAHPQTMSDRSTDVGIGLQVARKLLEKGNKSNSGGNFQAIILVTDGEDWGGSWKDEALECKKAGIKVIPVGVGTQAGDPVPAIDNDGKGKLFMKDPDSIDKSLVISHYNSALLDELAAIDGGSSFRIGADGLAGKRLFSVLDRLGKRELHDRRVMSYQDRSVWPYLLSLFALAIRLIVVPRKKRKDRLPAIVAGSLMALVFFAVSPATSLAALKAPGHNETNAGVEKYRAGDFEGALSHFDAAMVLAPDDARISLARGEALFQLERYEEADLEFVRAQSLAENDKNRAEALYNHGTTRLMAGDPGGAIEKFREALVASPGQSDALHNLELAMRLQEQQQQEQQQEQQQDQDSEDKEEQQDQEQQQSEGDQQQEDQGQEQQEQQQEQQEQQQQDQQDEKEKQDEEQQSNNSDEEQEAKMTEEPSAEELSKEQALQLLKALDHDEEEQIKAMQKRLQGNPGTNKKQW